MPLNKPPYTFQDFNQELNDLYKFLKQEQYREEEIKKMLLPITSKIKKIDMEKYFLATLMIVTSLVSIIYFLTYFDRVSWHLSAIGRIILIKILPYFDWRYLKTEPCLIPKFSILNDDKKTSFDQETFNCDVCEAIKNIDVHETIDEDSLIHGYIDLGVPVILTRGIDHWIKESVDAFFDQTTDGKSEFLNSSPCSLRSNAFMDSRGVDVGKIFERAGFLDRFFVHFQNCQLEAVKEFRKFTYRPDLLPDIYSPITYNWLVWNKHYNFTSFKKIDLVEKIGVFGQMFGKSYVRLLPRKNCEAVCPILDFELRPGEYAIFTSLWDLEYRGSEKMENVAAILEIKD